MALSDTHAQNRPVESSIFAFDQCLRRQEINCMGALHFFVWCGADADMGESTSLAKWSSMELVAEEDDSPPAFSNKGRYQHLLHLKTNILLHPFIYCKQKRFNYN